MTLPTAEMQFSVALMFSLERESGAWMTLNSSGMASGEGRIKVSHTLLWHSGIPKKKQLSNSHYRNSILCEEQSLSICLGSI